VDEKFLHRGEAPFGEKVWKALDDAVIGTAKANLSARRLLHVDGPYGLGLKNLPGGEMEVKEAEQADVTVTAAASIAVASVRTSFCLSQREIAAFEGPGFPMDLKGAVESAVACARQEDALVFHGAKALNMPGLLASNGTLSSPLREWTKVGAAIDDIIKAATKLDDAGFHGPYALALSPARYNLLLRKYECGEMTELDHVKKLVTDGVVKAPPLKAGVLLATGKEYASIVVGQDLAVGFVGPCAGGYEFTVSETVALRLVVPETVCVLK